MIRDKAYMFVIVLLITSVLILPAEQSQVSAASTEASAAVAISSAQSNLVAALSSVNDCERTGADVSSMIIELRTESDLLATANNAYSIGDYESAAAAAENCSDMASQTKYDALSLRAQAQEAFTNRLFWLVLSSIIALSIFVVVGMLGWRVLRRRFVKNALEMKPEVVTQP